VPFVGCLTLLNAMEKIEMTRQDLAELACHIEVSIWESLPESRTSMPLPWRAFPLVINTQGECSEPLIWTRRPS